MISGFEKSGTVLTVHLPAELDHPARLRPDYWTRIYKKHDL